MYFMKQNSILALRSQELPHNAAYFIYDHLEQLAINFVFWYLLYRARYECLMFNILSLWCIYSVMSFVLIV
jgi:hypothetical protein